MPVEIDKIAAMERMTGVPPIAVLPKKRPTKKVDLAEHVKGQPYRYRHGWVPREPEIDMPSTVNESVLGAYSDNGYQRINKELRRTKGDVNAVSGEVSQGAFSLPTAKAITALDASFGTLRSRSRVYRVVNPDAFGIPETASDSLTEDVLRGMVGKTITDHGYFSTTLARSSEMDEPISMELDVPKGARAIDMSKLSLNSFENELLLDRNTKVKITGLRSDTRTSPNGVRRRFVLTGKVIK